MCVSLPFRCEFRVCIAQKALVLQKTAVWDTQRPKDLLRLYSICLILNTFVLLGSTSNIVIKPPRGFFILIGTIPEPEIGRSSGLKETRADILRRALLRVYGSKQQQSLPYSKLSS